jgi:hypothetical protein
VTSYPPAPKTSWFLNGVILLGLTLVIQRGCQPLVDWLAAQGRFSYFGLVFIPLAAGLAGLFASQVFMRKYGPSSAIQKRLSITYGAVLLLWVLIGIAVIGVIRKDPKGLAVFSAFATAQLAVQIAAAWTATMFIGHRLRSAKSSGALSR